MSKSVKPEDLGEALQEELTIYGESVTERVNNAASEAIQKLVKLTRQTAPKGVRNGKKFASSIASVAMMLMSFFTSRWNIPKLTASSFSILNSVSR